MRKSEKIILVLAICFLAGICFVLSEPAQHDWAQDRTKQPAPDQPKPYQQLPDKNFPKESNQRPVAPKLSPAPEDNPVVPVVKKIFPELEEKLNIIIEDEKGKKSFDWRDITIGEVLRRIQEQTGINIAVSLDDEVKQRISLRGQNVPARRILDYVGRILRIKYAKTSEHGIWFDQQYMWLGLSEPEVRNHSLLGLVGDLKAHHIGKLLEESVAPVIWFHNQTCSLMVIPENNTIIGKLPPSAHLRIIEIIRELRERVVQGDEPKIEVAPELATPDWVKKTLDEELVCRYREPKSLRDIIFEIGQMTGTNINFDQSDFFNKQMPQLTIDLGRCTLRQVLDEIIQRTALRSYIVHSDKEIWLYNRVVNVPRGWTEETLWLRGVVKTYYVPDLARKLGEQVLVRTVKNSVRPPVWEDMSAMIEFHKYSGKLVVIQSPEIQDDVARFLKALEAGDYKKYVRPELTPEDEEKPGIQPKPSDKRVPKDESEPDAPPKNNPSRPVPPPDKDEEY